MANLIPRAILGLLPLVCLASDVKDFGATEADYSHYKTSHWLLRKC